MSVSWRRRLGVCVALMLALLPGWWARGAGTDKPRDFKGKVVPLAKLLEKFGSKIDPEASPHWLALVTDSGKVYPLIRDDGSRMFFNDTRLVNRPLVLTGRLFQDTHLLQVAKVHSVVKGKLCDIYYWCDICSIRRPQKQICDCCGQLMELREKPVK
jgi:hypothetical protein